MTKSTRYTVRLVIDPHASNIAAFLDMLRYDGAVVMDWTRADIDRFGGIAFDVTLGVQGGRLPSLERWASFGILATLLP